MGNEPAPVQHDNRELPSCTPPGGGVDTSQQGEVIPNLCSYQVVIFNMF